MLKYSQDIQNLHVRYKRDFQTYQTDIAYQYAVNLCLIQVGEAAGKLLHEENIVAQYPEIEWHNIYGLRNRITHGYGSVDQQMIFEISLKDIPKLALQCEQILSDFEIEHVLEEQDKFQNLSKNEWKRKL